MWRVGKPEKDGRYFVLVDMNDPVICNGNIARRAIPMVSNFREGKWLADDNYMEVIYWMEVPELKKTRKSKKS